MTIKRRIRTALALMILVPMTLMMAAFGIARHFSERSDRMGPGGSPLIFTTAERDFIAEFNRTVNEGSAALADPRRLAELDGILRREDGGSWAILREGRIIYRSSGAPRGGSAGVDFRWSFRFPDGSAGLLEFYLPSRRWPTSFGWGSPIPFLAVFAVLALCNGLLSWWVASGIVAPLARLRDAALRIGEGDLDSAFRPSGIDEFGEVGSAFEAMRAKLKAALERQLAEEKARKELIAHVSHDLRTPIAVIRGHAEGLRDGVASNPEMRARYLSAVLERAEELEALIETLFDFTRMDLDGAAPATMALELAAFLADARASVGAAFPSASISVAPSPASTGGEKDILVLADPASILRVLMNLTENSVKHCGSRAVAIVWRIRAFDGKVELSAIDDGEGVPPEDLSRLFEPFFRGDRARTRGGSGLGLAIVRKIMEAQGGSARAAAAPTGGLEISLLFREARSDGEADTDRRG